MLNYYNMEDQDEIIDKQNEQLEDQEKIIGYPKVGDPNFQYKIYNKREFYYYRFPERPNLTQYEEIAKYRKDICDPSSNEMLPHQSMLSNFINPETPYYGLLVFHGTGTGKTFAALAIADKFIEQVKRYNTFIYILVPGPILKAEWLDHLFKMYRTKYYPSNENFEFLTDEEKEKIKKQVITNVQQCFKILSYTTFVKRVLGDKIIDSKIIENNKLKTLYRKTDANEFERDIGMDRIYNMNNTILFADEAHNLTGNHRSEALVKIKENSINFRIVLLTATPMINDAHEIIELLNYIRPSNSQIEKNKIFQNDNSKQKDFEQTKDSEDFEQTEDSEDFEQNGGKNVKKNIKKSKESKNTKNTKKNNNDNIDDIDDINNINDDDIDNNSNDLHRKNSNLYLTIKDNGIEYLKNMARGYVSHLRGADPMTFAKKIEIGKKPSKLLFTKLIGCKMLNFQKDAYYEVKQSDEIDSLGIKSTNVSNFAIPILNSSKTKIIGTSGIEGINVLKHQLKNYSGKLNKLIAKTLFNSSTSNEEYIGISESTQNITGAILKKENLKIFSTKFYKALDDIDNYLYINNKNKESRTGFVYSNNVKVGIDIFSEVLIQNGYLEFLENSNNYQIKDSTICYCCGKKYIEHNMTAINTKNTKITKITKNTKTKNIKIKIKKNTKNTKNIKDTENDTKNNTENENDEDTENNEDYENNKDTENDEDDENNKDTENDENENENENIEDENTNIKKKFVFSEHEFYPATFIVVKGQSSDDSVTVIPEIKQKIIKKYYNNIDNKNGRYIKLLLGSKVMNEGVNLKNVYCAYVLDVYFNFGRVDQVIGRAIRHCSHYNLMSEDNVYPEVLLFKYAIELTDGTLSTDEDLYYKAELKILLIKKIERGLKEVAIDCPLFTQGNMFSDEITEFKKCKTPNKQNSNDNNTQLCPAKCDFTNCAYKCDDEILNSKYYDPTRYIYKKISNSNLNYSTFNTSLAKVEIDYAKNKIKELYMSGYIYDLDAITNYVKMSYSPNKKELFDDFFVQKALDELIPMTENDFINLTDFLYDKNFRTGYLIYLNRYYIFQPFDEKENVSMYYRTNYNYKYNTKLSLTNFIDSISDTGKTITESEKYIFDEDYYDRREEFDYVGIIDKNNDNDVFKLRERIKRNLDVKRAIGVPSFKGAVCNNAKSKQYLLKILKKIDIDESYKNRESICNAVMHKLFELEKYATGKNKKTYLMVPTNHPTYVFPVNLEDRVDYVIKKTNEILEETIDISTNKNKKTYELQFTLDIKNKNTIENLKKNNWNSTNNKKWINVIE